MIHRILLVAYLTIVGSACLSQKAEAGDPLAVTQVWNHNFAMDRPWHGPYYNQNYGQPLALIVPPTAHMRQTYSWGVSQNLMYPIHHQYGRSVNSLGVAAPGSFYATPPWPSHTDQFGVYYVRGPW